ncbi:MAG TPA: LamG-like jellyroll fold domain-containing protein, partial [Flavisolibacter sp.]
MLAFRGVYRVFKAVLCSLLFICISLGLKAQTIANYSTSISTTTFTALVAPAFPTLSGTADEGSFNNIPVGFDFWYMGVRYTSISASTNGYFSLGTTNTNSNVNNLSAGGSPRPVIAPLWDDLNIQAASNVTYQTAGTTPNRVFTIEYLNARWQSAAIGSTISFQVKLYEYSGRVQFIYRPESGAATSASASVGISAAAAGSGNFISLANLSSSTTVSLTAETTTINTKPASGQTYTFTPVSPAVPTNLSFSNTTSSAMTLNWTDNATNEAGYVIYRSTDGSNYTFFSQVAANSVNATVSGLAANTTYYWRVYSVSVGALSTTSLNGSRATSCAQPAPPTVTSPVSYCLNATAGPLTATGTNLSWGGNTAFSGSVGGTATLGTTTYIDNAGTNNKKTNFTTTASNITIGSVDYYVPANQVVTGMVLAIFNSAGTIIATSPTSTSLSAGATAVKVTSIFNYNLAAAGDYSIGLSSGVGNIGSDNPAYPISDALGYVKITGVSVTGFRCFNNIQFSGIGGSATAPTPATNVVGSTDYTVTQTVNGCTSAPATITVNVSASSISQTPTTNLISKYIFSGNALDASAVGNDGTLQNSPVSTADRFNVANRAYSFNGTSQYVSTKNQYVNPTNFTVSIWFKTTTTTGGKLIGFGSAQTGASGSYDRQIWMSNTGQVYFGVYNAGNFAIGSALSYNDNVWHQASATLSGTGGMALYIDGVLVNSNAAVTLAENISGYWRIGYDNMNGWLPSPASFFFNGTLDDALIYHRALTPAEITTIYNSPDGAGNNGPVCVGSTLSLTATTVTGATYSWTGPNGFTSSLQNPTLTYGTANAGVYTLQVTASGCTSTAYTTVRSTTGSGQWTGSVSTDWATGANWCSGVVPTSATNVIIPSTAVRMPTINSSVACNNLTINTGATLTTAAASILNIAGTLTANGTITNGLGIINFNGTSGQQTFSGVSIFYSMTVSNASG